MITRAITTCLQVAQERNWAKTYWAFDIHGTILKPTYKGGKVSTEFYPGALQAMQRLSRRTDIVRILYTCSYPHEIAEYIEYFRKFDIHFDYVNENPEVPDGAYGHYHDKFYFNVLMEDKAGFDGETDWTEINLLLDKANW